MGRYLGIELKMDQYRRKDSSNLRKPKFIKMSEIKPGRHCCNVYCTVRSLEKKDVTKYNGQVIKMAEGLVGDDTACANFRFVGHWIDKLSEGRVVSIRNGRSEVVNEHLRLETDIFGKVSVEPDVQIDSFNDENNLSQVAYVKKNRGRVGQERN